MLTLAYFLMLSDCTLLVSFFWYTGTCIIHPLEMAFKYTEQIWTAKTKRSWQTWHLLEVKHILMWFLISPTTVSSFPTKPMKWYGTLIWPVWRFTPSFLETFTNQQVLAYLKTLFIGLLRVMARFQELSSKQTQRPIVLQHKQWLTVWGHQKEYTHSTLWQPKLQVHVAK